MFLFYALILIPALFSVLYYFYQEDIYRKISIASFFVILFFTLSLRHVTVGTDLRNYLNMFHTFGNLPWRTFLGAEGLKGEVGYRFLNKVLYSLTKDYQFFLTVVAFITLFPIAKLYFDESKSPLLTLVIFVSMSTFVMLFSGLRQAIAISIGVFALYFTRKKRFFEFLAMVALAFSFHHSALILLFIYPVYHLKLNRQSLFIVSPMAALVSVFNRPIFNFLLRFVGERYYDRYGQIREMNAYGMIVLFVLFTIFVFVVEDEDELTDLTKGLRNILILATFLQLFAPIHTVAMRFNYYFIIFIPLLIGNIVKESDKKAKGFATSGAVAINLFFVSYYYYQIGLGKLALNVLPYKFFWQY